MNRPIYRRRRTLGREFLDSYRAGPRVWRLAGAVLFCAVFVSPIGVLALLVAAIFVVPAVIGALLGRLVGSLRDARLIRQLESPGR